MANWLVTGGAGFIGSHLVEALLNRNERVRVLDNFCTGHMRNLEAFKDRYDLVKGDIRDSRSLLKAMKGIDYVLHQAALRSVPRSLEDPVSTDEVNVGGTVKLLWAALRARVKRVVYASSSSVFGKSIRYPQKSTDPTMPLSPYAVSKLAGEHYCRVFSETLGLSTVSLRYFNVFGPRQDPNSKYAVVIPIFMKAALDNQPLPVHGDGRQSRDFAYIDNVVSANLLAAKKPGLKGEVFNVACGESHSLMDYVRLLERLSHRKLKVQKLPSLIRRHEKNLV